MASKIKRIKQRFIQLANHVSSSEEEWLKFLRFASHLQYYSFDVALLVYGQATKVTALATYDQWMKKGRHVKRGEKGICVSNVSAGANHFFYLFDISQTDGQAIQLRDWEINDHIKQKLRTRWNRPESFQIVLYHEIKQRVGERYGSYQSLVNESIYQLCAHRLGLKTKVASSDLASLGRLDNAWLVSRAGNTIMNQARAILSDIAAVADQVYEEENEHEKRELQRNAEKPYADVDRGNSEFNQVQGRPSRATVPELQDGGGRRQTSGPLGEAGRELSETERTGSLQLSDANGSDHHLSEPSRPTISRSDRSIHDAAGESKSSPEVTGSSRRRQTPKSATGTGQRTSNPGSPGTSDLTIENENKERVGNIEASVDVATEASSFSEEGLTPDDSDDFNLFNYQDKLEGKSGERSSAMFPEAIPPLVKGNFLNDLVAKPLKKDKNSVTDLFTLNRGYSIGAKEKFHDNLEAIRVLKLVEDERRQATEEEQQVMAKYVGWGGLANAFSSTKKEWQTEYQKLKVSLSEDEYQAARESTLTSYYTDPRLIRVIYDALDHWGVHAGRILDPAMGTGNFFSALPENMRGMERYGVELDSLTSRIATQLYPQSHVYQQGFETVPFPSNRFNAVVGNIPFNDIRIVDAKFGRQGLLIHDYFFLKALDLVKPGGIVVFITSRGTMDRKDSRIRRRIHQQAALIGAVRLPDNTFQKIAGTRITTDILFLQKRLSGEAPADEAEWMETTSWPNNDNIQVNEFFAKRPEAVLGNMEETTWIDGETCAAKPSHELLVDVSNALEKFNPIWPMNRLAPDLIEEETSGEKGEKNVIMPADTRLFTYFVSGNQLYYYSPEGIQKAPFKGLKRKRLIALCEVRVALNKVIQLQTSDYRPSDLQMAIQHLNELYDTFVGQYGFINATENRRLLEMDDQRQLLFSIEDSEKEAGHYRKAEIFRRPTIRPLTKKLQANSAKEAMILSLNEKLRIDFSFMQHLYPKNVSEIIEELGESIYLDPNQASVIKEDEIPTTGWVPRESYLSGDVKTKLDEVKEFAEKWPKWYARNVQALTNVLPKDLTPSEIAYRIGSTWIPVSTYQQFMYQTFDTDDTNQFAFLSNPAPIRVEYNAYTGKWRVTGKSREPDNLKVNQVYGTGRANAYNLFEACLNLQDVTIRDTVTEREDGKEKKRSILNPKETILARQKQQLIQEDFKKWVFADEKRASEMLAIYNSRFNRLVIRQYDGSSLEFIGMNEEMELRPHQKNVVARILTERRALMAHEVGAGKTAAMIAAGMYLKRVGAIQKPIYVVPNHLTEQWASEFLRFYPSANILVTTKKDFEKQNRRKFVSRIATGSYDAVIIGHSQFERIPLSLERQRETIQKQIDEISFAVDQAKREEGNEWSVKAMVRFQKNLETRLEKLNARSKKDDLLTFEELGVDFLFVDEAHVYKNCFLYTKMKNVAGVNTSNSQRAMDMLMKCQYMQEKYHGGNIVFATGTPISNSMTEIYVMQRYLQPDILEKMGLKSFDDWASTFGEVVSSLEITPEGSGYRMKTRFAKFHNLPELMAAFNQVADIQTAEMLHLPRPRLKGNKTMVDVTECSPAQKEIMDEFVKRSELIRTGSIDPTVDNMLKLTHEARLMAIDPRLVNPEASDDSDSKLNHVVHRVYEIWKDTEPSRLTQMIFCDASTPNLKRFNVYDEIKSKLIALGVPESDITFIHDAKNDRQRDQLFQKMRAGDVRILLGSTAKVGTGTNVQQKLIAAHHVDCPWRPADLTQRDGRILRQGNDNEEVQIFRYVTKGTFDSYLWQIQEQKLRYISQVMSGKSISRACDDMDETVLSAAEVKAVATDNPELLEKMSVDNEVSRLRLARGEWQDNQLRLKRNIATTYPDRIQQYRNELARYEVDKKTTDQRKYKHFSLTVNGKNYETRKDAGNAIEQCIRANNPLNREMILIGNFKGLNLLFQRGALDNQMILKGAEIYHTSFSPGNAVGNMIKLDNLIRSIPKQISECQAQIDRTKKILMSAKREVGRQFEYQDRLDELLAKQSELNLKLEFKNAPDSVSDDKQNLEQEESETGGPTMTV